MRSDENILLVGFRGAGKTTVGKVVARKLKLPFVDLDREIVGRSGMSIRRIFSESGEKEFRRLEEETLASLHDGEIRVIATGGGVIERVANRRRLKRMGLCVWLQVAESEIRKRLAAGRGRPSLTGQPVEREAAAVLKSRRTQYRESAHIVIRCGKASPFLLGNRISDAYHRFLKARGRIIPQGTSSTRKPRLEESVKQR